MSLILEATYWCIQVAFTVHGQVQFGLDALDGYHSQTHWDEVEHGWTGDTQRHTLTNLHKERLKIAHFQQYSLCPCSSQYRSVQEAVIQTDWVISKCCHPYWHSTQGRLHAHSKKKTVRDIFSIFHLIPMSLCTIQWYRSVHQIFLVHLIYSLHVQKRAKSLHTL